MKQDIVECSDDENYGFVVGQVIIKLTKKLSHL